MYRVCCGAAKSYFRKVQVTRSACTRPTSPDHPLARARVPPVGPLAVASPLGGVVPVLTSFAALVVVLHLPAVSSTADAARTADDEALMALGGDVAHPAVGVRLLVVILVLTLILESGRRAVGR